MAVQPSEGGDRLPRGEGDHDNLLESYVRLLEEVARLEFRLRQRDEQRRAILHIMGDLHQMNKHLSNQRKAMLHILVDYELDRRRLALQTERLDNSRRAVLHILQDSQQSNLRLEQSRKAMIHIMSDLHDTTTKIQARERELREKQELLVQAGKLATLGTLTTGIAHELNNPLNNMGLFIGNVIDLMELGSGDKERILRDLDSAMQQVGKATEIISHLRTFGRTASVGREPVLINQVIERSLALMQEQLRLRQIEVQLDLSPQNPIVTGSAIQLEQVFINLLTNARDALADSSHKIIEISSAVRSEGVDVTVSDTGPGIPKEFEQRIFDPFFTTKAVGKGTGLGLSITYGIVKDHGGAISLVRKPGRGATFLIQLPHSRDATPERGEE